ncbi:MAG: DNA-protecting protein DprA, partial [Burkholderiales bacterium]|nr:DNA-protecting protein DprA [Burkholderiales bacterium]
MTDAGELDAWLCLVHRPGLGRDAMRRLLASFGSAQAVARASRTALRSLVDAKVADEMALPPDGHAERLGATRDWLAAASNRQLITLGDPGYPAALLETGDPPLVL